MSLCHPVMDSSHKTASVRRVDKFNMHRHDTYVDTFKMYQHDAQVDTFIIYEHGKHVDKSSMHHYDVLTNSICISTTNVLKHVHTYPTHS